MLVTDTNAFRGRHGRAALRTDAHLGRAAEQFAAYMARTTNYGHTADGTTPADRAKAHGYDGCITAENIAYIESSVALSAAALAGRLLDGWKDSPEHRSNLLDPDFTDTGTAIARGGATGAYYAVQMFGRPASLRIAFTLTNTTDDSVDYTVGGSAFSLPPNVVRTHQECRPETLAFTGASNVSPRSLSVRGGEQLRIVRAADGSLRIEPAAAP